MKLAAVQFRPQKDDWEAALRALCNLITHAIREGAQLIVCPEMALTGYLFLSPAAARRVAEPAGAGRTFQALAPLAREAGCYLVVGYPEIVPESGALHNSAMVIGPNGALHQNYRKRLLFDHDQHWASPGDTPYPLLETPLGSLSVGICMDLNDDRFIRFLHRSQPDLVAFCTNWLHEGVDIRPYWRHRLRGAPTYFVAANTHGREAEEDAGRRLTAHFLGCSAVFDPQGETLAMAPEIGDAVLVVEVPDPSPS